MHPSFLHVVEHWLTSNFSMVYVLVSVIYADAYTVVSNRSRGRTRQSFYEWSLVKTMAAPIEDRFTKVNFSKGYIIVLEYGMIKKWKNNNTKIRKISFITKKTMM